MTDFLKSIAVFLRELYVLYNALLFHSRFSNLNDVSHISLEEQKGMLNLTFGGKQDGAFKTLGQ